MSLSVAVTAVNRGRLPAVTPAAACPTFQIKLRKAACFAEVTVISILH